MLPPVYVTSLDPQERANATHSWFRIKIKDELPFRNAILAQEWKEEQYLTFRNRLIGAVIGFTATYFLLWGVSIAAFISVGIAISLLISDMVIKPFLDCQMEIEGHMVEWAYAMLMMDNGEVDYEKYPELKGVTSSGYLLREAMALAHSYEQFEDWTQEEIVMAMRQYEPEAKAWVNKYYDKIKRKGNQTGD